MIFFDEKVLLSLNDGEATLNSTEHLIELK